MTSSPLRLLAGLVVAAGLLAGIFSVRPGWLTTAGVDFWNLPELYARIEKSNEEMAELEERDKEVFRHLDAKREVMRALRRDEMTLLEAAARFGQINEQPPETMSYIRDMYRGHNDEERLCRQVLAWLEVDLWQSEDSKGRATLARLQAELNAYLQQHETTR
jgi:hypothetical protein